MNNHLSSLQYAVTRRHREQLNGHAAFAVWLTGLSGSGKSTLANLLEQKLHDMGLRTYILDGDQVRTRLNKDLGFSESDRSENLRRVAEVARLMIDAGVIIIAAFITPFNAGRKMIAEILGDENLVEVYVKCPLAVCEKRDIKGLYAKARRGVIKNFTGIDSPYEEPEHASLVIATNEQTIEECVMQIFNHLSARIKIEAHNN